jgi:hypothetical protein
MANLVPRGLRPGRCARCRRRALRLRAGRLPDGRLAFAWCRRCLAEVQLEALGLSAPREPGRPRPAPDPPGDDGASAPLPLAAPADERTTGLRSLGVLLVTWGLVLQLLGAGSWLGFGRHDDGFGPTRIARAHVFVAAGALLAVAGAWVGLASLHRGTRARSLARPVEAVALGLGLSLLVVGLCFHEPRRDPWVIAGVVLAVAAARAARWLTRLDPRAAGATRTRDGTGPLNRSPQSLDERG